MPLPRGHSEQDLLSSFAHPDAAAAGALLNRICSLRSHFLEPLPRGHSEQDLLSSFALPVPLPRGHSEQDLLTAFAHPDAAAAGALLNNDLGSSNLLFFNERQPDESELSSGCRSLKKPVCDRLIVQVEIPGFEPGQTEPKSVVLPLHHISIPRCKDTIFLNICKRPSNQRAFIKDIYLN